MTKKPDRRWCDHLWVRRPELPPRPTLHYVLEYTVIPACPGWPYAGFRIAADEAAELTNLMLIDRIG